MGQPRAVAAPPAAADGEGGDGARRGTRDALHRRPRRPRSTGPCVASGRRRRRSTGTRDGAGAPPGSQDTKATFDPPPVTAGGARRAPTGVVARPWRSRQGRPCWRCSPPRSPARRRRRGRRRTWWPLALLPGRRRALGVDRQELVGGRRRRRRRRRRPPATPQGRHRTPGPRPWAASSARRETRCEGTASRAATRPSMVCSAATTAVTSIPAATAAAAVTGPMHTTTGGHGGHRRRPRSR